MDDLHISSYDWRSGGGVHLLRDTVGQDGFFAFQELQPKINPLCLPLSRSFTAFGST